MQWVCEAPIQWSDDLAVHVFSDGACRRPSPRLPGRCSCASVVQLYDASSGVCRLLGFWSYITRDSDSWSAEVSGLELASRLLVRVLRGTGFWERVKF
jgi:hypothetical protein